MRKIAVVLIPAIALVAGCTTIQTTNSNGKPVSAACIQAQGQASAAYWAWLDNRGSYMTYYSLKKAEVAICGNLK